MHHILFVCLGNICRSTMAQFVMTDLVSRNSDSSDRYTVINWSRKCNCVCSGVVMVGKLSGYSCYLNIIKSVAVKNLSCYICGRHSS